LKNASTLKAALMRREEIRECAVVAREEDERKKLAADASLEEASQMNGRGTLQTALRISLPAVRHATLSSIMFVTISALALAMGVEWLIE
jgi:hypothetical protein